MDQHRQKHLRQEFSEKSIRYNRFLFIRYGFAICFFANLNWLVLAFFARAQSLWIPALMLAFGLILFWEQFKLYHEPQRPLIWTERYFWVQILLNIILTGAAFVPKWFHWFFPMVRTTSTAYKYFALLPVIGVVLVGLLLYKMHRIKHNRDRYYYRMKKLLSKNTKKRGKDHGRKNNSSFMEKYLLDPLGKMSQTQFVRAIMNTGMATIPLTIVGSMFLVLNILPLAIPQLEGLFEASFFKISDLYMLANKATMGVLSLYFTIVLGYEYTNIIADEEHLNLSPLNGAILSLFAFIMTVPQLVWEDGKMMLQHIIEEDNMIVNGWAIGGDGVSRFGTVGIFSAIIMAVLATQLYKMCVKNNWTVKMPEAVPAGVARSFTALIPAFVIAFAVLLINGVLIALGTDLFELIQIPFGFVTDIAGSYLGLMVILFLIHALWSVGIHGAVIISSMVTPIVLANMVKNANGANIPFAGEFFNAYAHIGGSGATLLFTFYIAFMAKSEQLRVLGKAATVPALFNINEPIMFGVPMIYNPDLLIPFILAPMASGTVAYWATKLGFVRPLVAQQPWPTPLGIGAFIGTGGDWRAIIVAILCALAAFVIYLPFIRKYDKRLVQEEAEKAKELADQEEDDEDFFAL